MARLCVSTLSTKHFLSTGNTIFGDGVGDTYWLVAKPINRSKDSLVGSLRCLLYEHRLLELKSDWCGLVYGLSRAPAPGSRRLPEAAAVGPDITRGDVTAVDCGASEALTQLTGDLDRPQPLPCPPLI